MAKKTKKIKVEIKPNQGQVIQYGNKFRFADTMKFASKKDFAKSNFKMILDNPMAFKSVVKKAKGYDSYYNALRYKGKSLKKQVADFLKENFVASEKKEIKLAVKEKGFLPDMSMIMKRNELDIINRMLNFTFGKNTSYELDSGFLTTKSDNMHNIIKDMAYYRKKGYVINIIDEQGGRSNDIAIIKDFERSLLSDAQEDMEQEHSSSSKSAYIFNIEHELTVNDFLKTVTLDLRNATSYISNSLEGEIFKAEQRFLKKQNKK